MTISASQLRVSLNTLVLSPVTHSCGGLSFGNKIWKRLGYLATFSCTFSVHFIYAYSSQHRFPTSSIVSKCFHSTTIISAALYSVLLSALDLLYSPFFLLTTPFRLFAASVDVLGVQSRRFGVFFRKFERSCKTNFPYLFCLFFCFYLFLFSLEGLAFSAFSILWHQCGGFRPLCLGIRLKIACPGFT